MTRAELDLEAGIWTLPGQRTKNGRMHILPLSPAAVELLRSLPVIGRSGFVFTTTGKTAISGFAHSKAALEHVRLNPVHILRLRSSGHNRRA